MGGEAGGNWQLAQSVSECSSARALPWLGRPLERLSLGPSAAGSAGLGKGGEDRQSRGKAALAGEMDGAPVVKGLRDATGE